MTVGNRITFALMHINFSSRWGNYVPQRHSNHCIGWYPLDGDHINEKHTNDNMNVHVNEETVPYVMQVDKLAGGKMILCVDVILFENINNFLRALSFKPPFVFI